MFMLSWPAATLGDIIELLSAKCKLADKLADSDCWSLSSNMEMS